MRLPELRQGIKNGDEGIRSAKGNWKMARITSVFKGFQRYGISLDLMTVVDHAILLPHRVKFGQNIQNTREQNSYR